jgi:DNA-binding MarR family transcriptional regulator
MSEPPDLDPVIHVVARLRIVATLTALSDGDSLSFTRLKSMVDLTAGNLITHLRKLEEAGYVTVVKHGAGRSASTSVAMTTLGRKAFMEYSSTLRALLGPT